MRIAYLGPKNTFTEKIAKELFPKEELVPLIPIRSVIMTVENDEVEMGIVPLENFYNGYVIQTLDSLTKCKKTKIFAEKPLKIIHCLGKIDETRKITKIFSKDQALEQCEEYIFKNFPDSELVSTASTSEAAKIVSTSSDKTLAAISQESALKENSLKVIDKDLCPNNITRFIILKKEESKKTGDDKTILAIHPPIKDRPGVLADCLNIFGSLHINLESIYSRPDGKGGYTFYIELNGHKEDENVKIALKSLNISLNQYKKSDGAIKILGSFSNSHWKDEN